MKKIICVGLIFVIFIIPVGANEFSINEIIDNAPDVISENVQEPEDAKNLLSISAVINFLSGNLISALKDNLRLMGNITAVAVIMGIYESLCKDAKNPKTQKIADYACASLIAVLVCEPLLSSVGEITAAINDVASYVEISVPVLAAILTAQGNVSAATIVHIFMYNGASVIAKLFSSLAMPLCSTYIAVGLAACLSDNQGIKSFTLGVKNAVTKLIMLASGLFSVILSLQNILGKSSDILSKKALKIAVRGALPVGGAALSESVDAFWESLGILKSAGGIVAVCAVVYLIAVPAIKALVTGWSIRLCSLLGSLTGSKRAASMLEVAANAYSMLLSAAFGVTVIFVICFVVLLKAGGAV